MPGHRRRAVGLTVVRWSMPPRHRLTAWHVAPRKAPLRRSVCGTAVGSVGSGALVRECRTSAAARRAGGPICLRCAGWLARRGARPAGTLIPFPRPSGAR